MKSTGGSAGAFPPALRLGRTVGGRANDDASMLAIPGAERQPARPRRAARRSQRPSSARTARTSASTAVGTAIWPMAMSGSLSPCPVSTQTTVDPAGTPSLSRPATEAADAGSQKTDSS